MLEEGEYLLVDIRDGGVGSDDGLFIRGTFVHGQNARVDNEAQCRVSLRQFKCKQFCVVIDIRHLRKLPGKSALTRMSVLKDVAILRKQAVMDQEATQSATGRC